VGTSQPSVDELGLATSLQDDGESDEDDMEEVI